MSDHTKAFPTLTGKHCCHLNFPGDNSGRQSFVLGYTTCSFKIIIITPNLTGCSAFKVKTFREFIKTHREDRVLPQRGIHPEDTGPVLRMCRSQTAVMCFRHYEHPGFLGPVIALFSFLPLTAKRLGTKACCFNLNLLH